MIPDAGTGERPRIVLAASAFLAMLEEAPGGTAVGAHLSGSAISSVNWSEILDVAQSRGIDIDSLRKDLEAVGFRILPFTVDDADLGARLSESSRAPLSLSDRACLALATRLGIPAMTADEAWGELDLGVEIRLLR